MIKPLLVILLRTVTLVTIPSGTGALAAFFLAFFLSLSPGFAQTRLPTPEAAGNGGQNLPKVEPYEIDESLVRLSPIRFLPDHPLYFVITVKEKFDHFAKSNKAKKALFDTHLAGKKIKESYLLVQKNNFEKAGQTLKNYQKINQRLREELRDAQNQGSPVFETEMLMADNLERHLKIIIVLASQSTNVSFLNFLQESVGEVGATGKLLEKDLPDAAKRILEMAGTIKIT